MALRPKQRVWVYISDGSRVLGTVVCHLGIGDRNGTDQYWVQVDGGRPRRTSVYNLVPVDAVPKSNPLPVWLL